MTVRCAYLVALAVLAAAFARPPAAQGVDTVFLNCKIVTLDGAAPAQALAVRDGKIVAVGGTTEIRALAGPRTHVIELAGRTVGAIEALLTMAGGRIVYAAGPYAQFEERRSGK